MLADFLLEDREAPSRAGQPWAADEEMLRGGGDREGDVPRGLQSDQSDSGGFLTAHLCSLCCCKLYVGPVPCLFIHLFIKCLLSIYSAPSPVQEVEN